MFCVECGKDGPIYKDGVCIDCYLKNKTFTSGPVSVDLPYCSHCNSLKYKNTWTSEILSDILRRIIKNTFQISRELENIDINTDCKEAGNEYDCKVYITGFINNKEITEEHILKVYLKKTVCDVCSKMFGGYHEAIIQVRTTEKIPTKQELKNMESYVISIVENMQAKGNRGVFITDIGKEHNGLDFFISNKGAAQVIIKNLQEKYGGKIKQSSKNIGMKDSRQVYRMTYLLRIPDYQKNDIIKIDKNYFIILSTHGNNIKIRNLKTWDEIKTDYKSIENAKIVGSDELVKDVIVVSQNNKDIQIMDSKTYDIRIIIKPKPIEITSDKIRIIEIDNQLFLL